MIRIVPVLRHVSIIALLALPGILSCPTLYGEFVLPDLVDIPLERLIANLRKQAEAQPKNAQVRMNLARAHAMAYTRNVEDVKVLKGQEEHGVWFGHVSDAVPFRAPAGHYQKADREAREHLAKAISWYRKALELAPADTTIGLGYAWCLDQAGKTDRAIEQYRDVIEKAWKREQKHVGFLSVTAEAIGYLMPLLDPEKDKQEIATLKERLEKLAKMPRKITPIAVPLQDGLTAGQVMDRSASVAFDVDGSGQRGRWTWITPKAAWLVHDPRGTGRVTSGLQLFGSVTFWMFWDNGYQALASLDDNADGRLSGDELNGLALWHDADGDGVSDAGEVRPVASWGIVSISCQGRPDPKHPDVAAHAPDGITFTDGTTRPTWDIVLSTAP